MANKDLKISGFQGEYRFLSNFWASPMTVIGISYLNAESAYQASKTLDLDVRATFSSVSGGVAKRMGRKLVLRPDWTIPLNLEMMELCLRSKFMCNPDLREKLLLTGDAELEETNDWNDTFWGVSKGKGTNYLGKLLMEIRSTMK
jgi:ribA/ribD-fused uncharacterized protein